MGLGITFARDYGDDLWGRPEQFKKIDYAERVTGPADHCVIFSVERPGSCFPPLFDQ
jgi:hypothetical protein